MSELFPRALLVEALGNNPRLIAAFEQLDQAMQNAEAKIAELEERAVAVADNGYQPRNAILDALSQLPSEGGAIEQVTSGQFSIRPIDVPNDTSSLLSQARANILYAPHP